MLNILLQTMAAELGFRDSLTGAVLVSMLLLGAASGSWFADQVADMLGPRRCLIYMNIPLLIGIVPSILLVPESYVGVLCLTAGA